MISAYFTGPRQVQVRQEQDPQPGPGQALVQTLCSAISAGTEMLVYRAQFPADLALDENIAALSGAFQYPLRYGYAAVGRVVALGAAVDPSWIDRLVFAFQPHTSHFVASPTELLPLPGQYPAPGGITPEQAVFLPNMETALNFVLDGAPLIGEHAAVFGQGIVGLLTSALLRRFPLSALAAVDRYPLRRQAALDLGLDACLDPLDPNLNEQIKEILPGGADLVYELSGSPAALNQAIAATRFAGRVVVGSWYGHKRVELDLGGHFHRSRIRLISSQVSTLAPELSGRWDKARRFKLAWEMIQAIQPERWITQRFPIHQAGAAYELLDQSPQNTIQILLTY